MSGAVQVQEAEIGEIESPVTPIKVKKEKRSVPYVSTKNRQESFAKCQEALFSTRLTKMYQPLLDKEGPESLKKRFPKGYEGMKKRNLL